MLLAQGFDFGLINVVVFLVVLLAWFVSTFRIAALWFQAKMAGVAINLPQILGMKFRKVNPTVAVRALIMIKQAGIDLSPDEVEQAYLQGADVTKIAMALVRATREGKDFTFQQLVETDLGERP